VEPTWSEQFEEMLVSKPSLDKKDTKPLLPRSKQPDKMSVQDFETPQEKGPWYDLYTNRFGPTEEIGCACRAKEFVRPCRPTQKLEEEQHKIAVAEQTEKLRKGQFF
jgi:hypothetical protein